MLSRPTTGRNKTGRAVYKANKIPKTWVSALDGNQQKTPIMVGVRSVASKRDILAERAWVSGDPRTVAPYCTKIAPLFTRAKRAAITSRCLASRCLASRCLAVRRTSKSIRIAGDGNFRPRPDRSLRCQTAAATNAVASLQSKRHLIIAFV